PLYRRPFVRAATGLLLMLPRQNLVGFSQYAAARSDPLPNQNLQYAYRQRNLHEWRRREVRPDQFSHRVVSPESLFSARYSKSVYVPKKAQCRWGYPPSGDDVLRGYTDHSLWPCS